MRRSSIQECIIVFRERFQIILKKCGPGKNTLLNHNCLMQNRILDFWGKVMQPIGMEFYEFFPHRLGFTQGIENGMHFHKFWTGPYFMHIGSRICLGKLRMSTCEVLQRTVRHPFPSLGSEAARVGRTTRVRRGVATTPPVSRKVPSRLSCTDIRHGLLLKATG